MEFKIKNSSIKEKACKFCTKAKKRRLDAKSKSRGTRSNEAWEESGEITEGEMS